MAFRAVTRFSSLPWRNCLKNSLPLRSYSTGDNESPDVQPEHVQPGVQPVFRYT